MPPQTAAATVAAIATDLGGADEFRLQSRRWRMKRTVLLAVVGACSLRYSLG
jgi:hypothetical protein